MQLGHRRWGRGWRKEGVFICTIPQTGEHTPQSLLYQSWKTNWREGNVLFNNTLNIFYLRLYDVTHMVKDHSDSARGNRLPPHRLLFPISSKGSFICTIPQTGLCYTSRGALAGMRNSSMGHPMKDWSNNPSHDERTLLPRSYISLPETIEECILVQYVCILNAIIKRLLSFFLRLLYKSISMQTSATVSSIHAGTDR